MSTTAISLSFIVAPCSRYSLFRTETSINGFDKHIRRPETCRGPVPWIIIPRWLSRFHLLQCHAFFDHVLNAVTDDRCHIPIITHIRRVADPSMTGNNHRAALGSELGNRKIEDV